MCAAPINPSVLRNRKLLADVRSILKNFKQWPTSSQTPNQYVDFFCEKFKYGQATDNVELKRAMRQQIKDFGIMLKHIDRQKDIAYTLSGERAPQNELVKMAAARCGLAIPEQESGESQASTENDGSSSKNTAIKQQWRPDTDSEVTRKYKERVAKRIGN